jgi:hypothetical protein
MRPSADSFSLWMSAASTARGARGSGRTVIGDLAGVCSASWSRF